MGDTEKFFQLFLQAALIRSTNELYGCHSLDQPVRARAYVEEDAAYLRFIERLCKKVVCSQVQRLCPEAGICLWIRDYDLNRPREFPGQIQDVLPSTVG